jgi:hypothetical protein
MDVVLVVVGMQYLRRDVCSNIPVLRGQEQSCLLQVTDLVCCSWIPYVHLCDHPSVSDSYHAHATYMGG